MAKQHFLESRPNACRRPLFAEKRLATSISACGGSVSHATWLSSGRFSNAQYPLRSGLWHPLNIPLPRAPSERELQHGLGPAGCAVLLKAHFDKRFNCGPSGDLGGEEDCAADRASAMLEPPLGGGSGERHVQRMPEAASKGVLGLREPARRKRHYMRNRSPTSRNATPPFASPRTAQHARAVGCLTSSSPTGNRSGGSRTSSATWTVPSRSTTKLNGQEPPSPAAQRKPKT